MDKNLSRLLNGEGEEKDKRFQHSFYFRSSRYREFVDVCRDQTEAIATQFKDGMETK